MKLKNNLARRDFLKIIGTGCAALSLTKPAAASAAPRPDSEMLIYIGTYTAKTKSEGIYVYQLNSATGELLPLKIVKNTVEPSFLAITKSRRFLYAVNEIVDFQGEKSGAVSAFAINRVTGALEFLNQQPTLGGAPCHITVSDNEKFVLIANYLGGNVVVLPIRADGFCGAAVDNVRQIGSSVNRKRQEAAHAHSITLDKNNRYAFSCDLGADKIFAYRFDGQTGQLNSHTPAFMSVKPGAGPRHFVFHQSEKFAFVINELDSTITVFAYDAEKGLLQERQIVSTLPPNWAGTNYCADLHFAPNGKFLYGSNRGHDSIVSFAFDEAEGTLEFIEHAATNGKTPRNFAIDPTGRFLLAANQNSNSITTFRLDSATGKMQPINYQTNVPSPVCIKFIAAL